MMKKNLLLIILCCVCAALTAAAQTGAPEGMAQIPAGKFWMGRVDTFFQDSIDVLPRARMDDTPANNVYLDAFYVDKYEVTNADYARFLEATGARPPWHWTQGKIPNGEEKFPVANVNWFEANDYCKWVGKRLPTEAEWEKAARGGLDRNHYSWGDDDIDTSEGQRLDQSARRITNRPVPAAVGRINAMPVGSFPPNAYGLYDMMGNVMEWNNDWYDGNYYPFMPKQNPQGPDTGLYRSIRGAGWANGGGDPLMNWIRNFSDPELRSTTIGFRCAKDAGPRLLATARAAAQNRPYGQIMKDIGPAFANLRKNLDAKNAAAVEDAAKLEGLFKEVEAFWMPLGAKYALDFAKAAREGAIAVGSAAQGNDIEKAQASYAVIQRACTNCHFSYREDTGRGFIIKP